MPWLAQLDLPVHGHGPVGRREHGVEVQPRDLRLRREQVSDGDDDPGQRGAGRPAGGRGCRRAPGSRAACAADRRPRRRTGGRAANATSASASTQMPPSPTITIGPNDGSRNPPTATSVPSSWGCTSTASAVPSSSAAAPWTAAASASPSRTPSRSVRCSAEAILTTAGKRCAAAAAASAVRHSGGRGGRHPELRQQCGDADRITDSGHRTGAPDGLGRGRAHPLPRHGVAPGEARRPRHAGRPVEHRQPGLGEQVGQRAGPARRHPADVHRHGDPVGPQRPHGVAQARAGGLVHRRALDEHGHDGVDLAGAGEDVDQRRIQLAEPRPHRRHVDRVRRAGVGRQHLPDPLLQRGGQRGHGEAVVGEQVGQLDARYRRSW